MFFLCFQSPKLLKPSQNTLWSSRSAALHSHAKRVENRGVVVKCCQGGEKGQRKSFLSHEEAGLVEISGLSTHERFLCRLTISSLNLLRVISEQEGVPIEELNAGRVCDWFLKDKLKREQDIGSAVLQWDDSEFQI
ncbi:hypothetical protein J5N97_016842 [Dioscorea zingiberensis]|uniref:Receptor-interacting protein n=1 Tax=Dioscorea zingiberensis TaxID=325984 RepID=A0A9D5CLX2_9LILI|nr:hypothetical protein J5N97_016842 [Dioscorea zingiberensis]